MKCLDAHQILALLEGTAAAQQRAVWEVHLDACADCHRLLAEASQLLDEPAEPGAATKPLGGREPLQADGGWRFATGVHIDHFRVMRPLGRGGMGEIYLARDTRLGRRVALKVVAESLLGSAEARARFVAEAQTTARFNHPNIVTIHAVGEHDGTPYVALELLEGETLRERLDRGQLAPYDVLRIALAVAEALAEAHRCGVTHRDLKPGNVHIDRAGLVRVLDFGLAKVLGEPPSAALAAAAADGEQQAEHDRAASSAAYGTPSYMAPEQWQAAAVGPAADAWAFGVMVYSMLAGQLPFQAGNWVGLYRCVISSERAPPLDPQLETPERLAELVARCLEKDPAARPSSEELVATLEELLHERPERDAPQTRRQNEELLRLPSRRAVAQLPCRWL